MEKVSKFFEEQVEEYKEIDEDFIQSVDLKKNKIRFSVDLIDREVPITIKIKSKRKNLFEVVYEKTNLSLEGQNFEKDIKNLLKDFFEEREKNIDFYNEEGSGEDEEDNSEEEELVVEVEKEDWGGAINAEEEQMEQLKLLREKPFEVLDPKKMMEMQNLCCSKVSNLLYITKGSSKIVLREYRWNVEKVVNTFTEKGKEGLLKQVGISEDSLEKAEDDSTDPNEEVTCGCCFDDLKASETIMLPGCKHRFCKECWKGHIQLKITEGLSKRILCMGYKCNLFVPEEVVSQMIDEPDLKRKYDMKMLESFIEDNDFVKYCPSQPHCGNGIMSRRDPESPVEIHCTCGKLFCFNCLERPHLPASCIMIKEWEKKEQQTLDEDAESINWIKQNTRSCPKCKKVTFKNGGCNHITCPCGAHWCWACHKLFSQAKVYNHGCNMFQDPTNIGENEDLVIALKERFKHYFQRYNAHESSLKNQRRIRLRVDKKIKDISSKKHSGLITSLDTDWLKNGIEVLIDSRSALMNSYIFGFYLLGELKKSPAAKGLVFMKNESEKKVLKEIFESFQSKLEESVEKLSHLIDLPLKEVLMEKNKADIMKLTEQNERKTFALFDIIREEMVDESYFLPHPRFIVTSSFEYLQEKAKKQKLSGNIKETKKETRETRREERNIRRDNRRDNRRNHRIGRRIGNFFTQFFE